MKALVLYAHPNPQSFNHAVLETVRESLAASGHEVSVRDLYALGFDPVLKAEDFAKMRSGETPADIAAEQGFIREADLVVVVSPVWWFGLPAILKGYVDRVFSYGFAYRYGKGGLEPLLKGKKAFVFHTTGGEESAYEQYGFRSALQKVVDDGIFGFCGMEMAGRHFCFAVPSASEESRKAMLQAVRETAAKL